MRWYFKNLNYDILIPKLSKSIFQLDESEAESYFKWFMEMVPERTAYISHVCAMELGIPEKKMDCSEESLAFLWKWFRRRAKTEPVIQSEQGSQVKRFPNNIWENKRQLTLETEYILRDIGMYLGETFRKNNQNIYWTYYTEPRRDFFVNHPLLKGFVDKSFGKPFEACFEPIHMVGVQAAKIINKTSKDADLSNLYNLWIQKT